MNVKIILLFLDLAWFKKLCWQRRLAPRIRARCN
jgi:hypothetical protein